MSTSGPNNGSTFANDATIGTVAWTNPSNAGASDNSYATAAVSGFQPSQFLKATGFGFSIPAGATINGITVEVERSVASGGGSIVGGNYRLVRAGTIESGGTKTDGSWTTTDTYATLGSSSDLWGASWSASDINNSGFGAGVWVTGSGLGTTTAQVDHIRITVDYTGGSATAIRDIIGGGILPYAR